MLTEMCSEEATYLGFYFRTEESGAGIFSNDAPNQSVLVQEATIQVKKHRCLGVWVNEGLAYLKAHQEQLRMK